jgi:hypothetical protein
MKSKATSKVLRVVLITAVLVVGLVIGTLDKSGRVHAQSCYESMVAFHNANTGYYTARISYFYGQPTTCEQDCGWGNTQCIEDCQQTRQTVLAQSELTLFSSALYTCQPESVDQCAQARQMADQCDAQYDPSNYSNPEEYLAEWSQLSACRLASKIDMCQ